MRQQVDYGQYRAEDSHAVIPAPVEFGKNSSWKSSSARELRSSGPLLSIMLAKPGDVFPTSTVAELAGRALRPGTAPLIANITGPKRLPRQFGPGKGRRRESGLGDSGPGRDGPCGPPPGQNPACGFPAPGSHLGSAGSMTFGETARGPGVEDTRCGQRESPIEPRTPLVGPGGPLTSALEALMPEMPQGVPEAT
jgi:hypothetical protein